MDLKGAEIRNLKELCVAIGSRESVPLKVTIPYYQRPYKWDEQRISNLFSDYFKSEENEYFVGSVVMVENGEGDYDVIDGQQRTTTLFLLNYLKFILLRAYIEELLMVKKITKIDALLTEMETTAIDLFDSKKIEHLKKLHADVVAILDELGDEEDLDKRDLLFDDVLKCYQDNIGLPSKNITDIDEYLDKYRKTSKDFLCDCKLGLRYSRNSYNDKLLEALGRCVVVLSASYVPSFAAISDGTDSVIEQYVNALSYEFQALRENCKRSGESPLEYTVSLINSISGMLDKIQFCVIITGNEKDAYTLFEVLNDRSMPVEDLDLIKNLFYKWYCNKTTEKEGIIDKNIEKADKTWVEDVFSSATGKEQAKLVSFLAAEYFTADESLKFNDTARYRESIEQFYLNKCNNYEGVNLLNDIMVYQMVAIMLREMDFRYQKKGEKVISAECDGLKSITYRSLNLLHALKLYGVLPAITNIILRKFVDMQIAAGEKEIKISKFETYIKNLRDDSQHINEDFKDIHRVAYDFWRYALLAKNAEIPRQLAKKYISKNNAFSSDYDYRITSSDLQMKREFQDWVYEWRYSTGDSQLKAKVLFINLFETSRNNNVLSLLPTRTKFATIDIQLDHMEANKPNPAAKEKYFEPANSNEQRETYVNCIGNFMIMDRADNNEKNNLPLQDALRFYEAMAPGHWMITEVKELLNDDSFAEKIQIANEVYRVPRDEFFIERRARLLKYFSALLQRDIDETTVVI